MSYYEFRGLPFRPVANERMPLVSPREGSSQLRHVPFAPLDVLHLGGKAGSRVYASEIRLTPAQEAAFVLLEQTTGPLTVAGVAYPNATLIKLTGRTMDPRDNYRWYQAEWVIG